MFDTQRCNTLGKQPFLTEIDGTDLLSFLDLLFVAADLFNHTEMGNMIFD